jgi:peptidoglycan hydrolase CwlO-like protein
MNDQQFVNAYIRILNDTVTEAINKNLVMQAQLEVSKNSGNRVAELEAKVKELTNVSSDNNALQTQLNNLKAQLDQSNSQLNNKNSHVETFKRELIEARNTIKTITNQHQIESEALKSGHQKAIDVLNEENRKKVDSLNAEIELLKAEIAELKSRKRKREKTPALNTVESALVAENNLISVSDTF